MIVLVMANDRNFLEAPTIYMTPHVMRLILTCRKIARCNLTLPFVARFTRQRPPFLNNPATLVARLRLL